jgi:hypothetical protein
MIIVNFPLSLLTVVSCGGLKSHIDVGLVGVAIWRSVRVWSRGRPLRESQWMANGSEFAGETGQTKSFFPN